MCEFKVYSKNAEGAVAEDIVHAKIEGQSLLLGDVLGVYKHMQGVIVSEVDVRREVMELQPLPILREILAFSAAYSQCIAEDGTKLNEVEARWEEVKARGDRLISLLRKRS